MRHRERLRQLQPDTEETRPLHFLVEERRQTVDEKTRQSNRLTAELKLYFPQILQWFKDVTTPLVGELLERRGSLQELQRAHPGTLRKFFRKHNCRSEELIEERITGIYQGISTTKDEAVLEAGKMTARGLVALLATLRANIAVFEKRIEELVDAHPHGALFASLPGAGPALVPRLLVAFGTHRDRYQSAYEMQCYSGIAPVKEASGKPSGCISGLSAPSSYGRPFTSLPVTRSGNRSGPRLIMTTSGMTRRKTIMRPSARWHSNGDLRRNSVAWPFYGLFDDRRTRTP